VIGGSAGWGLRRVDYRPGFRRLGILAPCHRERHAQEVRHAALIVLRCGGVGLAVVRTIDLPMLDRRPTERGKAALAAYGISPPDLAKAATCPQCGSTDTEEVSRFGSTPCKAQWRCTACLEPFDRFKCH